MLQPVRDILSNHNTASSDLTAMADIFLAEAQCQIEQLRGEADVCMSRERYDLVECITLVASEYEDVHSQVVQWKESGIRNEESLLSPSGSHMGRCLDQEESRSRVEVEDAVHRDSSQDQFGHKTEIDVAPERVVSERHDQKELTRSPNLSEGHGEKASVNNETRGQHEPRGSDSP